MGISVLAYILFAKKKESGLLKDKFGAKAKKVPVYSNKVRMFAGGGIVAILAIMILTVLFIDKPPLPKECETYKKVVYVAKAEYLDNKPEAIEYAFAADLLSALETKVNNSFYIGGVVDDHMDSIKINGVFLVDSCVSSGILCQ